jgi:AAHS family benzoate transporter-like MFS transporter
MTTAITRTAEQDLSRRRTVAWVAGLGFSGLLFDGYDLVVFGAVLPIFLDDPAQIGPVTPTVGGALGSYALVGVLVGALLAGTVSDVLGRRKLMLLAQGWFALGMGVTAFTHSTTAFGLMRFCTGLGIGCLLATTAALVAEYAPPGRKNLYNALTYSGIAVGSTLSALLAIFLLPAIGWRGLFLIGAWPSRSCPSHRCGCRPAAASRRPVPSPSRPVCPCPRRPGRPPRPTPANGSASSGSSAGATPSRRSCSVSSA